MTNRDICGVEDCIGCTPCTVGMLHRYICIIMAKETNTMYTLLYDICTVSWLCLYIIHSHVQVVRQGTFTRSMSPPPSPVPCLSRATKRLLIFLLLKKNTKIYIYIYRKGQGKSCRTRQHIRAQPVACSTAERPPYLSPYSERLKTRTSRLSHLTVGQSPGIEVKVCLTGPNGQRYKTIGQSMEW